MTTRSRRWPHSTGLYNWSTFLVGALGVLYAAMAAPALSQEPSFAGRPGLAGPEQQPAEAATCENVQAALGDLPAPSTRIDLWITGELSFIHTDGALWYLVVCTSPGVRVMCVTYSDNGMKLGERVTLRGAYRPQDERHILLDPCLASRS
jgi:hypothetical protein